jgi:predicted RNA-binding Zn-ribbon protein involved in translation (DUF1610 family)
MAGEIRAKDVEVVTIRQAVCHVPGCVWVGKQHRDYQAANADRQAHIAWHWMGSRLRGTEGDAERGKRLYEQVKDAAFWCPACGGTHPLREHRECRAAHPEWSALRG